MRILVIAAKIHNFFRAQRRLDRLVIKIPGTSHSSVYKNRFQQEAESVAPRNVRNVSTSRPITPPMTADHHIGLPPNAAGRADDGISLKDLIAAFRRKTGMPKASPQDSSREAALARMESSANPNAPEPVIAKPKKLDPAAKFAVSICWMLGFMGTAIGVNEDQPAVLMFAAFVFFVGVILAVKFNSTAQNGGQSAFGKRRINRAGRK